MLKLYLSYYIIYYRPTVLMEVITVPKSVATYMTVVSISHLNDRYIIYAYNII